MRNRERFEHLSILELKKIAKDNGIKGISSLRKDDLIDVLCNYDLNIDKCDEISNVGTAVKNDDSVSDHTTTERYEDSAGSGNRYSDADNRYNRNKYEESRYGSRNGNRISDNTDPYAVEGTEPEKVVGILEIVENENGYGFLRCDNFLPGPNDVYVSPVHITRFNLKTGDQIEGLKRRNKPEDKFMALIYIEKINDVEISKLEKRRIFNNLTPIYPEEKISIEIENNNDIATRIIDLLSPIGKGQRGMIVAPPKVGKTTLIKKIANAITHKYPDIYLMILLIDERPEEVTDIKESIIGNRVDVIYSTFDEQPDHHKRAADMTIERAKRLVESGKDVVILLDSITRLTRASNQTVQISGRTLSGGLDPSALYMPKRFFGAARNIREGGSLTILGTALIETGSKMDEVIFEEFKGTGNMELILDRKLQEKRVFPAIDIYKSGTRRDDLLLDEDELAAVDIIHKALNGVKREEVTERLLDLFSETKTNKELVQKILNKRYI
ncbi:transcription termination factor Rho [Howardella ureilytica]